MNTFVKHLKDFRLIVLFIFITGSGSIIFGDSNIPPTANTFGFRVSSLAAQKQPDALYEYTFKIINFEGHPNKSAILENISSYFESNSKIREIDVNHNDKKYLVYSPKNVNEQEMIKHFGELNIQLVDFKKGTLSKLSEN